MDALRLCSLDPHCELVTAELSCYPTCPGDTRRQAPLLHLCDELDKIAGEPLDILVNNRLVARGEAVVVNDKFGIRITDIVSPAERLARLR